MKTVQKANKQLRVSDDRLDEMRKRGFVEVDEKTGKPIQAAAEDGADLLKKENAALKKENKALKEQVKALTDKVTELETAVKAEQ